MPFPTDQALLSGFVGGGKKCVSEQFALQPQSRCYTPILSCLLIYVWLVFNTRLPVSVWCVYANVIIQNYQRGSEGYAQDVTVYEC